MVDEDLVWDTYHYAWIPRAQQEAELAAGRPEVKPDTPCGELAQAVRDCQDEKNEKERNE